MIRSMLMVCLATTNVWTIASGMYMLSMLIGIGISLMWTLNVSDLAICDWEDRVSYVIGGTIGTAISLYGIAPYMT